MMTRMMMMAKIMMMMIQVFLHLVAAIGVPGFYWSCAVTYHHQHHFHPQHYQHRQHHHCPNEHHDDQHNNHHNQVAALLGGAIAMALLPETRGKTFAELEVFFFLKIFFS